MGNISDMMEQVKISSQGVIAFITNPSKTRFLIQRKDSGYKHANQHRTICFFGGHVESKETPLEAIKREVLEEIGHQPTVEVIVAYLDSWSKSCNVLLKSMVLESENNPGTFYELFMFEVIVPDEVLNAIEKVLYEPEIILEGYGEIVSRAYLDFIADKHPADFFSSLAESYRKYSLSEIF